LFWEADGAPQVRNFTAGCSAARPAATSLMFDDVAMTTSKPRAMKSSIAAAASLARSLLAASSV
jgi:hypothetical protein